MRSIWKFGAEIDEGAASVSILGRSLRDVSHDRAKLRARIVVVSIECIVPISQEDVAAIREIRDDQIVLGCEVPIKADLRHSGLFDDLFYAYGADTLAI